MVSDPFLRPLTSLGILVSGVVVLMILIPCVAKERASAKFVFTYFNTDNGEGIDSRVYIFVLGLLMSQYTLTGYDASAHMVSLPSLNFFRSTLGIKSLHARDLNGF